MVIDEYHVLILCQKLISFFHRMLFCKKEPSSFPYLLIQPTFYFVALEVLLNLNFTVILYISNFNDLKNKS